MKPRYFEDVDSKSKIIYQPDVYRVAEYLAKNFSSTHIVDIGCGTATKLVGLYPRFKIIGVDFGENLVKCRSLYPFGTWIEHDLEKQEPIEIPEEILQNSTIVCADVIEHLINPAPLLDKLKKLTNIAPVCIISTPERDLTRGKNHFGPPQNPNHVREWNLEEFEKLLVHYGMCLAFIGLTISENVNYRKRNIIVGIGNNESINDPSKWGGVASENTEILKKFI